MDIDLAALRALERERDISLDVLIPAIEQALLVAYHRTEGSHRDARVELDRKTGHVIVWAREEGELLPAAEGERAERSEPGPEFDDTPAGFGRIAASTARQVIVQRLRCFVVSVKRGPRGPQVSLSRTHPNLVRTLFKFEVPEIADGTVEIKAVAREAGHRSKIAVVSHNSDVSAKGACIGPMGQRVRAVMHELNEEKIDIIDYSPDPATFVGQALSPARVSSVQVVDESLRAARVVVPDYQLSLAIGREGQNARLAARLTGWRIDIRSDTEGAAASSG